MIPVDGLYVVPLIGVRVPALVAWVQVPDALVSTKSPEFGSYTAVLGVNAAVEPEPATAVVSVTTELAPLTAPTLTVIVVPVLAVIVSATPDAGSLDLGYAWLVAWLSASQVNVTAPSASVTLLLVVKLCDPIVNTKSPVKGL